MIYRKPTRTTTRWLPKIIVASLLVAITTIAMPFGYRLLASSSAPTTAPTDVARNASSQPQAAPRQAAGEAASPTDVPRAEPPQLQHPPRQAAGEAASPTDAPRVEPPRPQAPPLGAAASPAAPDVPRGAHRAALGAADGVVPNGTTVFDDDIPGVTNLDPALLGALRQAATDAANDNVAFYVTSGWRSRAYQNQLLREAVATYGSEAEAARWVATADTSPHVSGNAVDVGPEGAMSWLSQHGAEYGLCQIYGNEPWHYELRPEAIHHGCPPMYTDPTYDPRMQQ